MVNLENPTYFSRGSMSAKEAFESAFSKSKPYQIFSFGMVFFDQTKQCFCKYESEHSRYVDSEITSQLSHEEDIEQMNESILNIVDHIKENYPENVIRIEQVLKQLIKDNLDIFSFPTTLWQHNHIGFLDEVYHKILGHF